MEWEKLRFRTTDIRQTHNLLEKASFTSFMALENTLEDMDSWLKGLPHTDMTSSLMTNVALAIAKEDVESRRGKKFS